MKLQWPNARLEWRCAKKKEHVSSRSESPVTQFGAPDAPFWNLATARVTIIPAPLEYSVCYMKGTERGPQAILDAVLQKKPGGEE
jgi:agmatinase